jgi:nitric oxide reductase subunit C
MKKLLISAALSLVLILASCGQIVESEQPAVDPALLEIGETVFQANCSGCHSPNYDVVLVGPTMLGLATRAESTIEGMDAYTYIEQSILDPGAYLNEGFLDMMPPTYSNSLSEEELDALMVYLMTFD